MVSDLGTRGSGCPKTEAVAKCPSGNALSGSSREAAPAICVSTNLRSLTRASVKYTLMVL